MRAMVLAAGKGTRLGPLTMDVPKPMIEVGGRPILEYNLRLLAAHGIEEVVVNLHHLPDVIERRFGDGSSLGLRITYSPEEILLGTAGALKRAEALLNEGPFLVVFGDNLSPCNLTALKERLEHSDDIVVMAVYEREHPSASGIVRLGEGDRIESFREKPPEGTPARAWVNAGYLAMRPEILKWIPGDRPCDLGKDIIPALCKAGLPLSAYRMTEPLWWIDSPEDHARVKEAAGSIVAIMEKALCKSYIQK